MSPDSKSDNLRARSPKKVGARAGKPKATSVPHKPSGRVEVRRSSIQGSGVFARKPIAKGARIIEYVGERISHDEANARADDDGRRRHHTFLFTVDDNEVIDASRDGNEARFINHSCEPNCEAVLERKRVFIYAKRDIPAGGELLYDYWYTTDSSYTEADLRRLYPCRCATAKCRGTLAAVKKKRAIAKKPKSIKSGGDTKSAKSAKSAKRRSTTDRTAKKRRAASSA